jgi:hypothetical protein
LLLRPNLARMWRTWVLTVFGERTSCAAMSALVRRRQTRAATLFAVGERLPGGQGGIGFLAFGQGEAEQVVDDDGDGQVLLGGDGLDGGQEVWPDVDQREGAARLPPGEEVAQGRHGVAMNASSTSVRLLPA